MLASPLLQTAPTTARPTPLAPTALPSSTAVGAARPSSVVMASNALASTPTRPPSPVRRPRRRCAEHTHLPSPQQPQPTDPLVSPTVICVGTYSTTDCSPPPPPPPPPPPVPPPPITPTTPTNVLGSWRGLEVDTHYIRGEWDAFFGSNNLTLVTPNGDVYVFLSSRVCYQRVVLTHSALSLVLSPPQPLGQRLVGHDEPQHQDHLGTQHRQDCPRHL